ncbi:HNH endonuclease [Klebsiella pneumoniae]|nr:HNH endonuclease [Klebsiella pneumoniae]
MPRWSGSDRRSRLPDDWNEIRRQVLVRDGYRCKNTFRSGRRCNRPASDCDHIRPGDDHSPRNLQALCEECHRRKSSREGAAAVNKKRQEIRAKYRRSDKHPGYV